MNIEWKIQLVNELILEDPNATVQDFTNLLNELNSIENMPYDFKSPIMKMPFGKHKDKLFWTLPQQYFRWLESQACTPETLETIESATAMYENQGAFAVMKRNKNNRYYVRLITIMANERMAKARLDEDNKNWHYFIYHIQDKPEQIQKPDGFFPGKDDYFSIPKN